MDDDDLAIDSSRPEAGMSPAPRAEACAPGHGWVVDVATTIWGWARTLASALCGAGDEP